MLQISDVDFKVTIFLSFDIFLFKGHHNPSNDGIRPSGNAALRQNHLYLPGRSKGRGLVSGLVLRHDGPNHSHQDHSRI